MSCAIVILCLVIVSCHFNGFSSRCIPAAPAVMIMVLSSLGLFMIVKDAGEGFFSVLFFFLTACPVWYCFHALLWFLSIPMVAPHAVMRHCLVQYAPVMRSRKSMRNAQTH